MSYAETIGGLHEPWPHIIKEAASYYYSKEPSKALIQKIKQRMLITTPGIIDHRQSLVIPVIKTLDANAAFVWLIREPMSCINSFYSRGWYQTGDNTIFGQNRIREKEGWSEKTLFQKLCWHWVEVNTIILDELPKESEVKVIFTNSLLIHMNKRTVKQMPAATTKDIDYYQQHALPLWKKIHER
ncbi:MAG: hypothetical protein Q8O94_02935 [bacterium]|nr:hypothetical protein [bacterium]